MSGGSSARVPKALAANAATAKRATRKRRDMKHLERNFKRYV
jgi:hypothetical protein